MTTANPVAGVLLDITGVLKNGDTPIQGSIEAIERLRKSGLNFRFVTNETQVTKCHLVTMLNAMGFQVHEQEVFSPAPAMARVLKENGLRPFLLVHPNCLPDFGGLEEQKEPNCVVVGDAADHFTYTNMNQAFRHLLEMKVPRLYSLGRGKYYHEEDGLMLDVGAYTAALEYATGTKAQVMGKPEPAFFQVALRDMDVDAKNAIMVGDDVVSDVGGAQNCGLRGILVRTGKFRPSDETHPHVTPFKIAQNLDEAVDFILELPRT